MAFEVADPSTVLGFGKVQGAVQSHMIRSPQRHDLHFHVPQFGALDQMTKETASGFGPARLTFKNRLLDDESELRIGSFVQQALPIQACRNLGLDLFIRKRREATVAYCADVAFGL